MIAELVVVCVTVLLLALIVAGTVTRVGEQSTERSALGFHPGDHVAIRAAGATFRGVVVDDASSGVLVLADVEAVDGTRTTPMSGKLHFPNDRVEFAQSLPTHEPAAAGTELRVA